MSHIIITLLIATAIAWLWATGIDKMQREHPNYKGEDFLNFNNETEYDYYAISENSSDKKKGQKKQVSQKQTKAK